MIRLTHFFIIALVFFALRTQGQETTDAVSNPAAEQAGRSSEQLEAVVKPNKKVLLRWDVFFFNQTDSSYCTIERSINGKDFDVISIIKDQHADGRPEFVDEMPARGTNYYRVRFSSPGKADRFSPVAKAAVNADFAVKFYPNPVDKTLIVRSDKAIDLQLTDANGKVWVSQSLGSGMQLLDVSQLEKGLYIITLTQKETGRVLTDKLVKN